MSKMINLDKDVDCYGDMVYRIAMRYLNNEDDAKDIVQDMFLRYVKHLKSGKSFKDEEHKKSWIIRVTINLCYTELRAKSVRQRSSVPFYEDMYLYYEMETDNNFLEILNQLEEKYKSVLELFYLQGLSILEISKVLDITTFNVKTRLCRARKMIRKSMEQGKEELSYGEV